ncbi:MAG: DMT family transporter, partial [Halanaerobiales bacterium]|nr:DMT family transporter [Halanaerobiales bacterium]
LTPIFFIKYSDSLKYLLDFRPALVGFLLALHFYAWISAIQLTNVANAVIFIAIQPLFTLLLEYLFAKQDLRKGAFVGVVFALLGSIIISFSDFYIILSRFYGDMLAVLAALLAACYLFLGRSFRKNIQYIPYIYIVYTYCSFFLLIFVLISGHSLTGYNNINYIYFLLLALGPTLIGHSVLNLSIRYVPATIVSLAILGEPIMTTILALVIINEKLTTATIVGGFLILYGIFNAIMSNQGKNNIGIEEI